MPNQYGQNWQASILVGGTPGDPNWGLTDNTAPLVLEVQHQPLVPRSMDPITITARILDEQPAGITVNLVWRIDTAENANEFSALPMYDDGEHNDGPAGDGIYGLTLPAQPNNTVIEFYVEANDSEGRTRTWPAPALDEFFLPIQQANALLQVDDSVYTGSQPFYRIIMREVERAELQTYPSVAPNSDARMNATFIAIEPNGRVRRALRRRHPRPRRRQPLRPAGQLSAEPGERPPMAGGRRRSTSTSTTSIRSTPATRWPICPV